MVFDYSNAIVSFHRFRRINLADALEYDARKCVAAQQR
jgi:hypothetical protein